MSSTQSDIIKSITETRHESEVNNSKQKLMVPRRIIEEEVWFSGSELKTDNSSSEDENVERSTDIQDRIKKGAKKKTKTVTQSARSRKHVLREQHREEMITETRIQTFKEITTTTTSSSSTADANENDFTPCPQLESNFDALDHMLSKCEDTSHSLMKMACNKADDEKTQLQKIKQLEERIAKAEKHYMESRAKTNRLVAEMGEMLNKVTGLEGPDWDFFNSVTKDLIRCFSGRSSETNNFANCLNSNFTENDQNIEKNQLKKSRQVALKNKDKNKKLIKIRKGTNYHIVLRNIKQCPKTRYFQNLKSPSLNEQNRINSLLSSGDNVYHANESYMGYKLQPNEVAKLASISMQLKACHHHSSNSGLNGSNSALNLVNQYLEVEDTNPDVVVDSEYIQNASLTDSQKQRLFNASQSNLSLSDSADEYDSCDEVNTEFASSSNIEIM